MPWARASSSATRTSRRSGRLQGGNGQGLATYRELMRNLSTKTQPEGGALNLILDRWVSNVESQVTLEDGIGPDDPEFADAVERRILTTIRDLQELVHGYDFARLLTMYWRAHLEGDDDTKANVTKWFRGEYRNKTEARQELGVNIAIGDDDWYDYLKLFAVPPRCRLPGAHRARGRARQPLQDPQRHQSPVQLREDSHHVQRHPAGQGALPGHHHERHAPVHRGQAARDLLLRGAPQQAHAGRFAQDGLVDMLAPVIRLQPLTHEELLVLINSRTSTRASSTTSAPSRRRTSCASCRSSTGAWAPTPTSRRAR